MKTRFLRLAENKGTTIRHKEYKTEAIIVGSFIDGFIVETNLIRDNVLYSLKLPFKNINQWEVVEDDK